jgi:hypothetical protein
MTGGIDYTKMTDSEKLNHIIFILDDDQSGLRGKVRRQEIIVCGLDGKVGLAERVRNLEANWKAITVGISAGVSGALFVAKYLFTEHWGKK